MHKANSRLFILCNSASPKGKLLIATTWHHSLPLSTPQHTPLKPAAKLDVCKGPYGVPDGLAWHIAQALGNESHCLVKRLRHTVSILCPCSLCCLLLAACSCILPVAGWLPMSPAACSLLTVEAAVSIARCMLPAASCRCCWCCLLLVACCSLPTA